MVNEWTLLIAATVVMSIAMCAVGFFIERPKPRFQEPSAQKENKKHRQ